jgi:hypothetical protein
VFDLSDQAYDHYAVVTIYDVVLTKSHKCAMTTVLVALSEDQGWKHRVVKKSDNLVFQAYEPRDFVPDLDKLPHHLGNSLTMGVLYGAPVADITYTKTIK